MSAPAPHCIPVPVPVPVPVPSALSRSLSRSFRRPPQGYPVRPWPHESTPPTKATIPRTTPRLAATPRRPLRRLSPLALPENLLPPGEGPVPDELRRDHELRDILHVIGELVEHIE